MLRRVVDALFPVVEDLVIDCRADQVSPFERALAGSPVDPRFAVDAEPDRGPVAGLACGLDALDAAETVVVSCDRPGVTPDLFEHLLRTRRREGVAVALPAADGRLQPLCAVYETATLRAAVRGARRAGQRRLCSIPRGLSRHVLAEHSLASIVPPGRLRSVDTPLEARCVAPDAENPDALSVDGRDAPTDPAPALGSEPP